MRRHILSHLKHHVRFYISALIGAALYIFTPMLAPPIRLIAAGDTFFIVYLATMALLVAADHARGTSQESGR